MYKCMSCGKLLDEIPKPMIRCPNCAGKVLLKQRAPIAKNLVAR
ncbi:MAG: DNA-directed RNA polymerase subunit P [archaeon]